MDIFKEFGAEKLKIHLTRVELMGVSYSDANKAARQFDWVQFHIVKREDGNVDVNFVAHKEKTTDLYNFLKGDEPDPVHA